MYIYHAAGRPAYWYACAFQTQHTAGGLVFFSHIIHSVGLHTIMIFRHNIYSDFQTHQTADKPAENSDFHTQHTSVWPANNYDFQMQYTF